MTCTLDLPALPVRPSRRFDGVGDVEEWLEDHCLGPGPVFVISLIPTGTGLPSSPARCVDIPNLRYSLLTGTFVPLF